MKIQLLHQSVKSSAVHSIEKNGNDSNDFQTYQESGNFGLGVAAVVCIKHHSIKKYHTAHSHSSWNLKDRSGLAAELPAKKSGRSAQTLQVIKYIGIILFFQFQLISIKIHSILSYCLLCIHGNICFLSV